jgi:hypothetical protein
MAGESTCVAAKLPGGLLRTAGDEETMGKITDLMLFDNRCGRGADELSDEAMVRMLRAAADEITELRALVQRIAIIARDPEGESPGSAQRKLRAIASMLKDHRH